MGPDLNDPESIVRWHAIWPERHAAFLKWARKAHAHLRPSIDQAIAEIKRRAAQPQEAQPELL